MLDDIKSYLKGFRFNLSFFNVGLGEHTSTIIYLLYGLFTIIYNKTTKPLVNKLKNSESFLAANLKVLPFVMITMFMGLLFQNLWLMFFWSFVVWFMLIASVSNFGQKVTLADTFKELLKHSDHYVLLPLLCWLIPLPMSFNMLVIQSYTLYIFAKYDNFKIFKATTFMVSVSYFLMMIFA